MSGAYMESACILEALGLYCPFMAGFTRARLGDQMHRPRIRSLDRIRRASSFWAQHITVQ
ncbi:hypothetical protein CGRA01v4_11441 [Colletotrichum graminicola]|nr:hypothetical protein CGRA01v4_11441 [Colletotrichum graminicola]